LRISSITVDTSAGDEQANLLTQIIRGSVYDKGGVSTTTLGEFLNPKDTLFIKEGKRNPANYKEKVAGQTTRYITETFIEPIRSAAEPKWYQKIWNKAKSGFSTIAGGLINLPRKLAEILVNLVQKFWVPLVAHLANFLFNVTIEAYVYVLMLAYPLWFHKKTEQAFKGALNTLISTACTAAVFCYLILAFESFAGHLMAQLSGMTESAHSMLDNNQGASAAAGVGLVAVGAASNGLILAGAAAIGIAVGYAFFYMIGTMICLALAPKIFKAFLTGGSVVTPMLMGAATAVVGGVAAGAAAAIAAPGMLAGGAALAKGGLVMGAKGGMAGIKGAGGAMMRGGRAAMGGARKAGSMAKKAALNPRATMAAAGNAIGHKAGQALDVTRAGRLAAKHQIKKGASRAYAYARTQTPAGMALDAGKLAVKGTIDIGKGAVNFTRGAAGGALKKGEKATSAFNAGEKLRSGISGGLAARQRAIEGSKSAISRVAAAPMAALKNLPNSTAMKAAGVGAVAMGGDLKRTLSAAGQVTVAAQVLNQISVRNSARTTNTTPRMDS